MPARMRGSPMQMNRLLCIPGVVFGCLIAGGAPVVRSPQAQAVRASAPIVVDGRLDEAAWTKARWAGGFHAAGIGSGGRTAAVQTRFKAVWTADALYVAVECDEPRIEAIRAETPRRDGAVWQDDCVEIFFDPADNGRYYHQIMVNAHGTIFDLHAADFGLVKSRLWDGVFRAAGAVDREQRRWRVEVEIPFGALILPEDAGPVWRWNVTRERRAGVAAGVELSSWAPSRAIFISRSNSDALPAFRRTIASSGFVPVNPEFPCDAGAAACLLSRSAGR